RVIRRREFIRAFQNCNKSKDMKANKAIQLGRKFGSWLVIGITLLAACSAGKTDVRKLVEGGATAMNSYDLGILFGEERLLDYQSLNGRQWGTVRFRTNGTIALEWHSWWGRKGSTVGTWLISKDRICYTWPEWPSLSGCTHWYRTGEGKFAEATETGRVLYNVAIK
ncbi:MAG: hypothetical protein RDU41_10550, partial [Clostridia bacterium]|nr:hypothetical protein [Clostridia bacterium]